jgi:hypothetical protein
VEYALYPKEAAGKVSFVCTCHLSGVRCASGPVRDSASM